MRIVPQSVSATYCLFSVYPLLCAPRVAGLLCAPKPAVAPPTNRTSAMSRVAAYLDVTSARLTTRYASIDAEVEAMRLAYGIRPREIVMTEVSA